jgi:hypothetical protein
VPQQGVEFRDRTRIVLTGADKADNGLTYGVKARIRLVSNNSVNFDKAYGFFQGGFGEGRLGTMYGPNDDERYFAPSDLNMGYFGIDGNSGAYIANNVFLTDKTATSGTSMSRVSYYTPEFYGFHLSTTDGQRRIERRSQQGRYGRVCELP